ncbi:MAG: hypothetical protein KF729_33180 [Sandaracinaceae bacterium]|nr:hypothetical protein [Sandaracinaceae bacterium]
MRTRWWWLGALSLLVGCEEPDAVADPEPVAPVAVTAGESEEDVAALRARVAELEGQLAECHGATVTAEPAAGGTEVAAVPEDVAVPGAEPAAGATTPAATGATGTTRGGRRGRTDDSLLGTLLGPVERAATGTTPATSRRGGSSGESGESGSTGSRPGTLPNPLEILTGQ